MIKPKLNIVARNMSGHIWGVCPVSYENMFVGECKNPCSIEDIKELERGVEMEKKDYTWRETFEHAEENKGYKLCCGNLEEMYQAFKARLIDELDLETGKTLGDFMMEPL